MNFLKFLPLKSVFLHLFILFLSPESHKNGEYFCQRKFVFVQIRTISSTLTSFLSSSSSLQPACETGSESERSDDEYAVMDWDQLGFRFVSTDYMYFMKSSKNGEFTEEGEVRPYGEITLSPSSGVLNYGQGIFEGLKAYRKEDGSGFLLFRPEENALRMKLGAERMCMPSPSPEQFMKSIKNTLLANKRWVPPPGKGSLYLRPLLMGSGPVLGLAPAPEFTFLVYAAPVGNYFKEGLSSINLLVAEDFHRAVPGGTGGVKTIANYAPVLKAQLNAKSKGFTDVLFIDPLNKKFLEEAASCNIFIIKGRTISTPATNGSILSGITRKSIIDIARDFGYQVKEGLVSLEEMTEADEVFCTGTAVVVAPVGSVTYCGKRIEFKTGSETVSMKLHKALTSIQMGLVEDTKGWVVEIDKDDYDEEILPFKFK